MSRKTVLITGCSSGIGQDAAHGLAARGWRVFATCRKDADCARLRDAGLESFRLDYADEDSLAAAVDETLARTGGTLDALFNNGAYAIPGLAQDLPRDALRAIFETNLFGQFDLINRLMPTFRAQGHGRVVNNSSVLGLIALRARGAYISSKFAMEGLTDVYRLENRMRDLHFILIEPGPVTSRIRENSVPHFERWIDWKNSPRRKFYEKQVIPRLYRTDGKTDRFELPASAVTAKLVHALESPRPRARYYVTTPTYMMGAARRILPTRALDRILRRG
ncbi:SDR family NAD(P)-dependent oxidoreductase [Rhodobacteraceae bacterium 2CG4]|uniref:SDR family NAD(P)-dependent oxidoreductase n=1 Tax=Halovulum marinum TaxID=2662447 RepID=A0A6L5YV29_9RHOB|nr:SDR family NAD(P)-dependent oxidoreductase [Halovulum marinum]MSU88117.1 SDR family NAD(P)-dependent oxidoreductase [Halovulum marinum]